MKFDPIRKTRLVEVVYWDCGCVGHDHTSEYKARACMRKRAEDEAMRKKVVHHQEWRELNPFEGSHLFDLAVINRMCGRDPSFLDALAQ